MSPSLPERVPKAHAIKFLTIGQLRPSTGATDIFRTPASFPTEQTRPFSPLTAFASDDLPSSSVSSFSSSRSSFGPSSASSHQGDGEKCTNDHCRLIRYKRAEDSAQPLRHNYKKRLSEYRHVGASGIMAPLATTWTPLSRIKEEIEICRGMVKEVSRRKVRVVEVREGEWGEAVEGIIEEGDGGNE